LNENEELSLNLRTFFEDRNCFLMPHPGNAVMKKCFQGDFTGIIRKIQFIEGDSKLILILLKLSTQILSSTVEDTSKQL
jgi:hypothetical protein